jgi:hypothetical protein
MTFLNNGMCMADVITGLSYKSDIRSLVRTRRSTKFTYKQPRKKIAGWKYAETPKDDEAS